MGILGNIRNWAGEHRARREEAAAASRTRSAREAELIKRHNVRRDPTTSGRYIDVNLSSEESVEKASETLAKFETNTRFGLVSSITFPNTSYNFLYQGEEMTGYRIFASFFPFDDSFCIDKMENAVVNVMSAGSLGWTYLGVILDHMQVTQSINETTFNSSPDGMYM